MNSATPEIAPGLYFSGPISSPPPHPRFDSLRCHLRSGGFAAKAKLPDVGDLKLITVSAIWKLYKLFYHRDSSSKIGGFCTTCSSNVFQDWNMEKE